MIENIDRTYLLDALTTEVNGALITTDNHSFDNSFVENRVDAMLAKLKKYECVPAGICKSIPFLHASYEEDGYIAFAFYRDEELQWIHFPKIVLFSLLRDAYGYKRAEEIYSDLKIDG